jgi:TPP-dependent pyruvate/acetoin dehydrogenase alpha subunit
MPKKSRTGNRQTKPPAAGAAHAPVMERPAEEPTSSQSDTLRRLYAALLRCRRVQEQLQNAVGSAAPSYDIMLGHEAVTVGASADLTSNDTLAASPRNLAAQIARGAPPGELLSRNGTRPLRRPTLAVPDDPFHAGVGIALARKLEKKRGVVLAVCAQRRPALDIWRDGLHFAVAHKLPIIFVIENGIEPHEFETGHLAPFSFMVRGHKFPGIIVDGSDVVAVWRVVQESVHRARLGLGPTLIDCRTDAGRDPLAHLEHYMRARNLWDESWKQQIACELAGEIERALATTASPTLSSEALAVE